MDTVYVNIDDNEFVAHFEVNPGVPEGSEGHYTAVITKELLDKLLFQIGFREVPNGTA